MTLKYKFVGMNDLIGQTCDIKTRIELLIAVAVSKSSQDIQTVILSLDTDAIF